MAKNDNIEQGRGQPLGTEFSVRVDLEALVEQEVEFSNYIGIQGTEESVYISFFVRQDHLLRTDEDKNVYSVAKPVRTMVIPRAHAVKLAELIIKNDEMASSSEKS